MKWLKATCHTSDSLGWWSDYKWHVICLTHLSDISITRMKWHKTYLMWLQVSWHVLDNEVTTSDTWLIWQMWTMKWPQVTHDLSDSCGQWSDHKCHVTHQSTLDDEMFVSVPHDRQHILLLPRLPILPLSHQVVPILSEETLDLLARHHSMEPVFFLQLSLRLQ